MTYAEQLAQRYAEIRERTYGKPRRVMRKVPPIERTPAGTPLLRVSLPWHAVCNRITRKTEVPYERMLQMWDCRAHVVRARHEVWVILYRDQHMSLQEIASLFHVGKTTIAHAVRRWRKKHG